MDSILRRGSNEGLKMAVNSFYPLTNRSQVQSISFQFTLIATEMRVTSVWVYFICLFLPLKQVSYVRFEIVVVYTWPWSKMNGLQAYFASVPVLHWWAALLLKDKFWGRQHPFKAEGHYTFKSFESGRGCTEHEHCYCSWNRASKLVKHSTFFCSEDWGGQSYVCVLRFS